jgi:hypothetical protein
MIREISVNHFFDVKTMLIVHDAHSFLRRASEEFPPSINAVSA